MSRGQLPRAYLRIDPALAFTHPRADLFLRLLCLANVQPARGRFRDWTLLCSLFGESDVKFLRDRGDVVREESDRWYVTGWDEWQEGDVEVGERMRRMRAKRRNSGVTEPSPDRIPPSEASRRQGVETEPPTPLGRSGAEGETSLEAQRRTAVRYWTQLGGRPSRRDRRAVWDALASGQPIARILGSIAERVRDELVAAGRLGVEDPWPPPGLAPYDGAPPGNGPPGPSGKAEVAT